MSDKEFFAHPQAIVDTPSVGQGTRIWAFSHVMKGAQIGRNCNIGEQCYVEGGVVIGDDVVMKNGVALWEGIRIEDRVFLGPNCSFTNDRMPRSKIFKDPVSTLVRVGASIGANATIICGIQIGIYALVGAGSVVTRNVPDFGLVVGNPARLRGYVCSCGNKLVFDSKDEAACNCGNRFLETKGGVRLVSPSEMEMA